MGYVLRYKSHEIELKPGRFVIGRAASSELALDDPLVSRQHAVLVVSPEGVSVEDLGSRNGVLVNDARISGTVRLRSGDRLKIGSQEMVFSEEAAAPRAVTRAAPTARFSAFGVVGSLADKALALGHTDEAERLLAGPLEDIAAKAEAGHAADSDTNEKAAAFATRLALATGKADWVNYAIRLYRALERPLPVTVVDALHDVLRKVGAVDRAQLRAYVESLRARAPELSPSERFLIGRIEGLERLAALR